jgi:hypothetical protein
MRAGGSPRLEPILSSLWDIHVVNEQLDIDTEAFADEIGRYLAAVDLFRAVDCEPTWRPEWNRPDAARIEIGHTEPAPSAH